MRDSPQRPNSRPSQPLRRPSIGRFVTFSNSAGNPIDATRPRPALRSTIALSPRFAAANRRLLWLSAPPVVGGTGSGIRPEHKGMEAQSKQRSRRPMVCPEVTDAYSSRNRDGTKRNRSGPVPSRAARRRHSGGTKAEPELRRFRYKVRGVGPRADTPPSSHAPLLRAAPRDPDAPCCRLLHPTPTGVAILAAVPAPVSPPADSG